MGEGVCQLDIQGGLSSGRMLTYETYLISVGGPNSN